MLKAIAAATVGVLVPTIALADAAIGGPQDYIPYPEWIIFFIALVVAAWWSKQAFDRPSVNLAGIPTLPRYMTRPNQYKLARASFVALSLLIYALMVRYHTDFPDLVRTIKPDWSDALKSLIDKKDPSYLIIIVFISACFLTLLKVEKPWNFYLYLRDIFYSWVAIPHLTNRIIDLASRHLTVSQDARREVSQANQRWRVSESDFEKNPDFMDRLWAELCYLHWWVSGKAQDSGTSFFSESSFAWDPLRFEFDNLVILVDDFRTQQNNSDRRSTEISKALAAYRNKLARIIACYLVAMNSTRAGLLKDAKEFGISLDREPNENPLRYIAIYIAALFFGVYLGVYLSAVIYDIATGTSVVTAMSEQTTDDVQRWIFLAIGNYGIPILGILALRYIAWLTNPVRTHSILVTYAWVFVIAAILSTLGLALMSELVGRNVGRWDLFWTICLRTTRWSVGPALICVFINHFLDRQTDPTRPDIEPAKQMPVVRIAYAVLFTLLIVVLTLPSMPSIQKRPDTVWEIEKLRSVAMGTIAFVTLSLSIVAQFGLKKPSGSHSIVSPRHDTPSTSLRA